MMNLDHETLKGVMERPPRKMSNRLLLVWYVGVALSHDWFLCDLLDQSGPSQPFGCLWKSL